MFRRSVSKDFTVRSNDDIHPGGKRYLISSFFVPSYPLHCRCARLSSGSPSPGGRWRRRRSRQETEHVCFAVSRFKSAYRRRNFSNYLSLTRPSPGDYGGVPPTSPALLGGCWSLAIAAGYCSLRAIVRCGLLFVAGCCSLRAVVKMKMKSEN